MQQTSLLFPHKASHPLAAKTLTIVLSVGAHYLIASNLGIFGSFTPLKLKSGGGTVKVVSLTPAERARVPEAVRSNPAPIAQNPVDPASGTRSLSNSGTPRFTPTSQPSPSSSNRPKPTATKNSQPAPNRSTTKRSANPKSPFDKNNPFPVMEPRSSTGTPTSTGTSTPTSTGTPTSTPTTSGKPKPTPTPSGTSIPAPTPKPAPTSTDSFEQLQSVFESKVSSVISNKTRTEKLPTEIKTYPKDPLGGFVRCKSGTDSRLDGYIFTSYEIDESFTRESGNFRSSTVVHSSFLDQRIINRTIEDHQEDAIKRYEMRSSTEKAKDKGLGVKYKRVRQFKSNTCN
jgi:hypothetical protein